MNNHKFEPRNGDADKCKHCDVFEPHPIHQVQKNPKVVRSSLSDSFAEPELETSPGKTSIDVCGINLGPLEKSTYEFDSSIDDIAQPTNQFNAGVPLESQNTPHPFRPSRIDPLECLDCQVSKNDPIHDVGAEVVPAGHKSPEEFRRTKTKTRDELESAKREYAQWCLFFNVAISEFAKRSAELAAEDMVNGAHELASKSIAQLKDQASKMGVEPFPA